MKNLIILCVLLFLGSIVYAQQTDSLKYKYTNQTIYRYGSSFMKGTERLSFQGLRNEFSMSELGLAGYDKAKKYKTTSIIFRLASIVAGVATIAIIANDGNRNTAYFTLGGQLVLGMVGGRYSMLSNQSLDKALWQRNKDLLFPAR